MRALTGGQAIPDATTTTSTLLNTILIYSRHHPRSAAQDGGSDADAFGSTSGAEF
jgi:hypothetical protein